MMKKIAGISGPLVFSSLFLFFHSDGLSQAGVAVLGIALWMAIWWIFDVTDIAITALLPIILFPLSGALDVSLTTSSYGHKYIFLYLGGFILAVAIEKWNLHKRIALNIISKVGASISKIILGFMLATAFMSMWISNTATTVMMLPIGLAIILQLEDHPDTPENENEIFGKKLMLAIAYSASIGGIATLFGTPPNLVFAGVVKELYGVEITFLQWLMVGLPISIILLGICWIYLTRFAFQIKITEFPGGQREIERLKSDLGKMSIEEKWTSLVFVMMALMLICRQWMQHVIPSIDDTIIALGGGLILCLLPSREDKHKRLLSWEDVKKIPWGVLILFGGGMALAKGFTETGLAAWIGNQFLGLEGLSIAVLVFVLVLAVNFLTEITSNLATTAMLLPILAPIATTIGVHPYMLLVPATLAASCAFMLPVATPPNAVVFGSGKLKISDMTKTGIVMNTISVLIVSFFVIFLLSIVWTFD